MISSLKDFLPETLPLTSYSKALSPQVLKIVGVAAILTGAVGIYTWVNRELNSLSQSFHVEFFDPTELDEMLMNPESTQRNLP